MASPFVKRLVATIVASAATVSCHEVPASPRPGTVDDVIAEFTPAVARLDTLTSLPIYGFPSGFRNSMLPLALGQVGIPDSLFARTFAWDSVGKRYYLTALTGAPPDGTRFLLYSFELNAVGMGGPPTQQEIGRTDLRFDTLVGPTMHIQVVADSIRYLDLSATRFDSSAWSRITTAGTLRNGALQYSFVIAEADSARTSFATDTMTGTVDDSAGDWHLRFARGPRDMTLTYALHHGQHSVTYAGTVTGSSYQMTLTIDDSAVALVSGIGAPTSMVGVGNRQLTASEIAFATLLAKCQVDAIEGLGVTIIEDGAAYFNVLF